MGPPGLRQHTASRIVMRPVHRTDIGIAAVRARYPFTDGSHSHLCSRAAEDLDDRGSLWSRVSSDGEPFRVPGRTRHGASHRLVRPLFADEQMWRVD